MAGVCAAVRASKIRRTARRLHQQLRTTAVDRGRCVRAEDFQRDRQRRTAAALALNGTVTYTVVCPATTGSMSG
jgi:ribosomal protein L32